MSIQIYAPQVVRCIAFQEQGQWVACSLEFGLAAQGVSMPHAKRKLEEQLNDYVAMARREEPAYGAKMLSRRAPFLTYLRWYGVSVMEVIHATIQAKKFEERIPPHAIAA